LNDIGVQVGNGTTTVFDWKVNAPIHVYETTASSSNLSAMYVHVLKNEKNMSGKQS
jgi:hypothetical protein